MRNGLKWEKTQSLYLSRFTNIKNLHVSANFCVKQHETLSVLSLVSLVIFQTLCIIYYFFYLFGSRRRIQKYQSSQPSECTESSIYGR